MKRVWIALSAVLLLVGVAMAQFQLPLGSQPPSEPKEPKQQGRTLTGVVIGQKDAPLSKAIVYLKNTKTSAIKTFIAQDDGSYRFPGLSPYIDYDIYAEYNGKKSDTKTLSNFDSRTKPNIVLKIDIAK